MPRPEPRWVLTPHPDTVKTFVTAETLSKARAYLQQHPELPAVVRHAIEAHEVWLGMSVEEVRLSIGPPTGEEPLEDGGRALIYASEGWVFRFTPAGWLREYVER